ncbi:XTP/dITP diphosphohydrolase [Desulfonatronum thiosulfatophilum]|uniref:dITP/XTP pyrophosphatase n=1 Tax=Desulfonatronum thiosulfatophilum TaxID=617002 RepID=A0A1G6CCR8_9BACT|nr:RdgB/HAM1 family non-canonical purine NTP pyrophosphatase [Desulfonatronum thiosulfatophilum]SDB30643.1 XTP/dITP diphosphohydrolase [Desulfonatronum thiosulfatophilum]
MEIVIASRNRGKAAEIAALLGQFDVQVLTMDSFPEIGDIPETGTTFEENALIKARTVARLTGMIAMADDSGLEVEALGGAPGVYSARFSGPDATDESNNALLLAKMEGVPQKSRQARFVSVIAVHAPVQGGKELLARGSWSGQIALRPLGENGFGYDPLFLDEELGLTSAQLLPEQKNARSHRAAAMMELARFWPDFLREMRLPEDLPR